MIKSGFVEIVRNGETTADLERKIRSCGFKISMDASAVIHKITSPPLHIPKKVRIKIARAGELGVVGISEEHLFSELGVSCLRGVGAEPLDPIEALFLTLRCEFSEVGDCIWCVHTPVNLWLTADFVLCPALTEDGLWQNALLLQKSRAIDSEDVLAVRMIN